MLKSKKYIQPILFIICLILFVILTTNVLSKDILKMDTVGYNLIANTQSDNLTTIVKFITNLGSSVTFILLAIILIIFTKNKKIGLTIFLNLPFIFIINQILKIIIARPRPTINPLIIENGYSFPSGHSMVSMAFYGYLIYLIFKYISNKYLKYFLIIILSFLILAIGLSRIYLGVHYPSDVCAGYLLSLAYLILYIPISNHIFIERNVNLCKGKN